MSARLDHFAEQINQKDQVIAENSIKLQSLACLLDQFKTNTEAQLLLIDDQLKVLHDVPNVETNPQHPSVPVVTLGLEQEKVVEGLCGKVKGQEQLIQTEGLMEMLVGLREKMDSSLSTAVGLREMVVGLQEKMDSSLITAVTSQSNTSGPVFVGRINLGREHDVVRKGIEWLEKLIFQLISTEIPINYVDIALIRKCNTIDLPALQSASKTCEKYQLKYSSLSDIDNSYCDQISNLLDRAESWL